MMAASLGKRCNAKIVMIKAPKAEERFVRGAKRALETPPKPHKDGLKRRKRKKQL